MREDSIYISFLKSDMFSRCCALVYIYIYIIYISEDMYVMSVSD